MADFVELIYQPRLKQKSPLVLDRLNPVIQLDDDDKIRQQYRFDSVSIKFITDLIRERLIYANLNNNRALSPENAGFYISL